MLDSLTDSQNSVEDYLPLVFYSRDEAWLSVMVAVPAMVSLNIPTTKEKVVMVQGKEVEVACLVKKTGHPAPTISLSMNKSSDMAKPGGGRRARVSYYPTMEETGSVFICKWEQVGPGGEVLYQGEEVSAPLDVMMAPSILPDTPAEYQYQDSMQLLVIFLAKPAPAQEDVQWYMVMENQARLGEEEMQNLDVLELGVIKQVVGQDSLQFETSITLSNLTENITLEINIRNMAGSVRKAFVIMVPIQTIPSSAPFSAVELCVTTPIRRAVFIVCPLALLLFTIILVLITILLLKCRRTGQQQSRRYGYNDCHPLSSSVLQVLLLPENCPGALHEDVC